MLRPSAATVTSMSITDGGLAYERNWPVAHTRGRWVTSSIAAMQAPRPHPPNRNPPVVHSVGTTGSCQRAGSDVGWRS